MNNKHLNLAKRLVALTASVGVAALLSACSNLSGLGGSSSLSCPLDAGGTCQSIRATYEQMASGQMGAAHNAPAAMPMFDGTGRATEQAKAALFTWNATAPSAGRTTGRDMPASGQPIRSESDVLRVWVAPYEDDEGVLRDQAYAYVVLDNARWMIEHNQRRIMQTYAPVKAPDGEVATNNQNIIIPGNPQ